MKALVGALNQEDCENRWIIYSSTLKHDLQACLTFVVTPIGVASVGPAPLAPDGSSARGAPGVQARLCLIPPGGEVFLGQGLLFDKGVVGKPLTFGRKLHLVSQIKDNFCTMPCVRQILSSRWSPPCSHSREIASQTCTRDDNQILRKFLQYSV